MGGFARSSRLPFSLLTPEATLVQASQEGSWRPQPFREAHLLMAMGMGEKQLREVCPEIPGSLWLVSGGQGSQ